MPAVRRPKRQKIADAVLSLRPVSYWPLDDSAGTTAVDLSTRLNGTYTNGRTFSSGLDGLRVPVFTPGSNQYVLVGNQSTLRTSNITLMAFVAPTGISAVADKGIAGVQNTSFDGYGLRLDSNVPKWRVGSGAAVTTIIGPTLTDNRWSLLIGVQDGANASLYVDGSRYDFAAAAYSIGYGATVNFYIGQWDGNATRSFGGSIQHVAVWNRALSASDIRYLGDVVRGS